ncbi:MAG: hypothetical protein WBK77_05560 [Alphaproteobacteria bacterium]
MQVNDDAAFGDKARSARNIGDSDYSEKGCSEAATHYPLPQSRTLFSVAGWALAQGIEYGIDAAQNFLIKSVLGDRDQIEGQQVSLVNDPAYDFPTEINGIPTAEALRYPATMEAFKKIMIEQGATDTLKGLEKYEALEKARDNLPSKETPQTPADCENRSIFYVSKPLFPNL